MNILNWHQNLYFDLSVYFNIQYAVDTEKVESKIFISAKCMCDMEKHFEQKNCKTSNV